MATLFSINPVKLAFELSMRGIDKITFNVLAARTDDDDTLVEAVQQCEKLGVRVLNKPRYYDKMAKDSHWETDLGV